jgi:hypothetical protein
MLFSTRSVFWVITNQLLSAPGALGPGKPGYTLEMKQPGSHSRKIYGEASPYIGVCWRKPAYHNEIVQANKHKKQKQKKEGLADAALPPTLSRLRECADVIALGVGLAYANCA